MNYALTSSRKIGKYNQKIICTQINAERAEDYTFLDRLKSWHTAMANYDAVGREVGTIVYKSFTENGNDIEDITIVDIGEDNITDTLVQDTNVSIKITGDYKAGKTYKLTINPIDVHWKSNNLQYCAVGSYSVNTISSDYLIDSIRLATEVISGKIVITYVPTADCAMIGFVFYLGAGTQNIDIYVDEYIYTGEVNEGKKCNGTIAVISTATGKPKTTFFNFSNYDLETLQGVTDLNTLYNNLTGENLNASTSYITSVILTLHN